MHRHIPVLPVLAVLLTATSPAFSFPSEAGEEPGLYRTEYRLSLFSAAADASLAQLAFEDCTLGAADEIGRAGCLRTFKTEFEALRAGIDVNRASVSLEHTVDPTQQASVP